MKKPAVLVVDDSDFDRAMLVKALTIKTNLDVFEARSGGQCLDFLASEAIDLVLLDILMPDTKGSEILAEIRREWNVIELPVIMVTVKSDTVDIISCLQAGANDYITKPVNFEVAVSRISTHLKLAELSRRMSVLKELEAIDAMIATYNHEINNPLAIAIGCLELADLNAASTRERLRIALWRIADIVQKIRDAGDKKQLEYYESSPNTKMIKVKP